MNDVTGQIGTHLQTSGHIHSGYIDISISVLSIPLLPSDFYYSLLPIF